jgi:hypothetical protein
MLYIGSDTFTNIQNLLYVCRIAHLQQECRNPKYGIFELLV